MTLSKMPSKAAVLALLATALLAAPSSALARGWRGGAFFYAPYVYVPSPTIYVPPVAVYPAPPAVATPLWQWCSRPEGYYPYVRHCDRPWVTAPASPR